METVSNSMEKELSSMGFSHIAGIDEAGRGPLAGPIVAGVVIFPNGVRISGMNDSKRLSENRRKELFEKINQKALVVEVGVVETSVIDKINILQATFKAMRIAVGKCNPQPDFLLIDGSNHVLLENFYPQRAIIGGDKICHSIAAASIVAKVIRDQMIIKLGRIFPKYGLEKHKGYGTKFHCEMIEHLGASPAHRKSFKRVREFIRYPKNASAKILGQWGEDEAVYFLSLCGYLILFRNYYAERLGEIDIIALDINTVVFLKVKTCLGHPEELKVHVGEKKNNKLRALENVFLA